MQPVCKVGKLACIDLKGWLGLINANIDRRYNVPLGAVSGLAVYATANRPGMASWV